MESQPKGKKLGKLYGSPQFASGPKSGEGNQAIAKGNQAKGHFATGPAPVNMAGHKAAGPGNSSGTKRDQSNEDYAGQASGRRGNVKA